MASTGVLKVDGQTISAQTILDTELVVTKRINGHSMFSFSLLDREGALYGTDIGGGTNWEDSMGKTVTFQHSDNTYNFVGRVQKVVFKASSLQVSCVGGSTYARDYILGSSEGNFIISTGYVQGDPTDYQGIAVSPDVDDDEDFTWDPNFSLYTERDIGVVFQDTSNTSTKTWDSSGGAVTGTSTTVTNTHTATQTEDGTSYVVVDNSASYDATVTITCTDTANKIDSSANIVSIQLFLNMSVGTPSNGDTKVSMGLWHDGDSAYKEKATFDGLTLVTQNVMKYEFTDEKDPFIIEDLPGGFLYDSGAAAGDLDTIKVRFTLSNVLNQADGAVTIDFLSFKIIYQDAATNPIMAKIYGNDAETLYLSDGIYDESTGITWDETTGANSEIDSDYAFWMGHDTVWKFSSTGDSADLDYDCAADEVGTFQFWVNLNNTAAEFQVTGNTAGSYAFKFYSGGDGKFYMDGVGAAQELQSFTADTWYHVEIVWATTAGGGDGLDVEINSVNKYSEAPGLHDDDGVTQIFMRLSTSHTVYMDAPGINGVGGYSTDDNKSPDGGIGSYTQGVRDGDYFLTGYSTATVLSNIFARITKVNIDIDSTFDKYFPRNCRGKTVMEILEEICDLEGASWYEEYDTSGNCIIGVRKDTAFDNSDYKDNAHAITTSNYEWLFTIEREYNHYKGVRVLGNPNFEIDVYVEDTGTNTSDRVFSIIDEKIYTEGEAYEVAYEKLQTLKNIQPSIHLNIEDAFVQQLDAGKDVTFTCARPTLTGTYPIRRITYHYGNPSGKVWAEVWLGLGQSPPDEKLANQIEKGIKLARKIQTDKLDPTSVIGTPAFSHTSLSNVTASQHHTAYTDADVNTIVATHTADVDAHLTSAVYTAMVEGALPYLEANKQWLPCLFVDDNQTTRVRRHNTYGRIISTGSTNFYAYYKLLKPTTTTTYKLMIDGVRVSVDTADANNEIQDVMVSVSKHDAGGEVTHFSEATPNTADDGDIDANNEESEMEFADRGGNPGDLDCTGYTEVIVSLNIVTNGAAAYKGQSVELRCWYEAT